MDVTPLLSFHNWNMAQRLVETLPPVMGELLPIIQDHLDHISYNYVLKTTERPNSKYSSRTELTSITITFDYGMRIRTRELIKKRIVSHFEYKLDPKKQVQMAGHRIEKIEISIYQISIHFADVGVGHLIVPRLIGDEPTYPFQADPPMPYDFE